MAQTRLRPLVHPSWEEKVNEKLSPDRGVSDFGESPKDAPTRKMEYDYTKHMKSDSALFVPDPNTSRQKIVLGDKQTLEEIQSKFKEGDEVVVIGKDGKKNNRFTGVFKGVFNGKGVESVWVSLGGDPKMFRLDAYEIVPYIKDSDIEVKKMTQPKEHLETLKIPEIGDIVRVFEKDKTKFNDGVIATITKDGNSSFWMVTPGNSSFHINPKQFVVDKIIGCASVDLVRLRERILKNAVPDTSDTPTRKGGVTSLRSRKLGVINPPDYKDTKFSFPTPLTELSPTIKLITSLLKKKEPEPQLEILETVCETCKGFIFHQKSETPSCHRCNP